MDSIDESYWDPLGKTAICGDGDCDWPDDEGKTPRNERLLP
jgi:hypothetical protein